MLELIKFNFKRTLMNKSSIVTFVILSLFIFIGMTYSVYNFNNKISISINGELDKEELNQLVEKECFAKIKSSEEIKENKGIIINSSRENNKIIIDFEYNKLKAKKDFEIKYETIIRNYYYGKFINENINNNKIPELEFKSNIGNEEYKESSAQDGVTVIIYLIIFYIVAFLGSIVMMSIVNERLEKTLDLLIYRIEPHKIILSKIYASILYLIVLIITICSEVFVFSNILGIDMEFIKKLLNAIDLDMLKIIGIILVSFVGIVLFLYMYVFCSIGVKEMAQLQTAQLPPTMLLLGSFYLNLFLVTSENLFISSIVKYMPVVSVFITINNIVNNTISSLDLIIFLVETAILFVVLNIFVNKSIKRNFN